MACPTAVALRSGDLLPRVGLGVYKALPKDTEEAVASALKLGYRHVDTAQICACACRLPDPSVASLRSRAAPGTRHADGNEAEVGQAVRKFEEATGERVWITTKARSLIPRCAAPSPVPSQDRG